MKGEVCHYLKSHDVFMCEIHGVCCMGRGKHLHHLVCANKSDKEVGAAIIRLICDRHPSLTKDHPCDSYAEFGKVVKDIIADIRSSDREPWCRVQAVVEDMYVCGCNKGKPKKKHHFLAHIRKGAGQANSSTPRCPWSLLRQPGGIQKRSEDWEKIALGSCQVKVSRATCGFTTVDWPSSDIGHQHAQDDDDYDDDDDDDPAVMEFDDSDEPSAPSQQLAPPPSQSSSSASPTLGDSADMVVEGYIVCTDASLVEMALQNPEAITTPSGRLVHRSLSSAAVYAKRILPRYTGNIWASNLMLMGSQGNLRRHRDRYEVAATNDGHLGLIVAKIQYVPLVEEKSKKEEAQSMESKYFSKRVYKEWLDGLDAAFVAWVREAKVAGLVVVSSDVSGGHPTIDYMGGKTMKKAKFDNYDWESNGDILPAKRESIRQLKIPKDLCVAPALVSVSDAGGSDVLAVGTKMKESRSVLADAAHEVVVEIGGCEGDWCLQLQRKGKSLTFLKQRSLRKWINAKHWIIVEKNKSSVLRGLVRGAVARDVSAPDYLNADARKVIGDLLEEAGRKRLKLLFTYAMPDPKNCICKSAADLLVTNESASHVFLFSDNQDVVDEYESLLYGPLSESEEWEVSRWVGRAEDGVLGAFSPRIAAAAVSKHTKSRVQPVGTIAYRLAYRK